MRIPHFFIERPIFATVISIIIVLVGGISYFKLPVSQYPEIALPTIQVNTVYPGANAEEVIKTVLTPLEQEINGVENMLYMVSEATGDGNGRVRVVFNLGTDTNQAQVLVQNRVSVAEARLPETVRRIGVQTEKVSPNLLLVVHLFSPDKSLTQKYISNYAILQLKDRLARIKGIGNIGIFGGAEYAMRIWIDPDKAASYGLSASEIISRLRTQNIQVASGSINQEPSPKPLDKTYAVRVLGRLATPEQFGNVVLKVTDDNRIVRVKNIARVELDARNYATKSYLDDYPAVAMVFFERPGSNSIETVNEIKKSVAEYAKDFPKGLSYEIIYNPTQFVEDSIERVFMTIFEAIFLVVLVVYVFLQSWRAAIIPIVAIPISLIGTFFIMSVLGFSANILTLLGLVLAIGIVVDDAIVVVENVERKIEEGADPTKASHAAMDEVATALIAMALVVVAVFVPTAFLGGITGQFYQQFAVTLATATVISAVVSLTLSPALCRILLRPKSKEKSVSLFFRGFGWFLKWLTVNYGIFVNKSVRKLPLMIPIYLVLICLTIWVFTLVPKGFIPEQDQGYFIASIELPPGSSLYRTDKVIHEVSDKLRKVPGVSHTVSFAGFSGITFTNAPNSGVIFLPLDSFKSRKENHIEYQELLNNLRAAAATIKDALVFVVPPPPVRGIGSTGGYKMMIQDRGDVGLDALSAAAYQLIGAANSEPGLVNVFTIFNSNSPEIFVNIDRAKAEKLGVPISRIFESMQLYLGSAFINEFNYLGRTYQVIAQADAPYRDDVSDVLNLRVQSIHNTMVPLGSVATISHQNSPYYASRYNMYPAIAVQGAKTPDLSTGEALDKMEKLAKKILPNGVSYEWTEFALQEKLAGNYVLIVFMLSVVFVFLLLAAQFESWSLPMAIILIVPMCILSAMSGIYMAGIDNNILVQIALIVLIGLASKNAILIVEFSRQQQQQGKSLRAAVVTAAKLRLRPILMTSFSFILGVVPLMLVTGGGAELRRALGTAVFSGMIGVTVFGLIFTPMLYVICRYQRKDKT